MYTKEERGISAVKRYYVGKEALDLVDCEGFELNYYILEDEVDEEDMRFSKYGIEIEKKEKTRIEKSQVNDITTDQARIDFIVKTLMKNNVTPVHLYDVIADML